MLTLHIAGGAFRLNIDDADALVQKLESASGRIYLTTENGGRVWINVGPDTTWAVEADHL